MANRSILIELLKGPGLVILGVILVSNLFFSGWGCAIFHRYPAYRGKVLELGTDKPLEKAGVIAVYWLTTYYWPERNSEGMGYQAVLTGDDGWFEVPAKYFFTFRPLASFDANPRVTIYKKGYGSFPASFGEGTLAKRGKTAPEIGAFVPAEKEVTFRMPKLETAEEMKEHGRLYVPDIPGKVPPKGMSMERFEELFGY